MTPEQRPATRTNQLAIWALVLLALLAAWPALAEWPARARANADYTRLNRGLAQGDAAQVERAAQDLGVLRDSPAVSRRAWRGLALAAMSAARLDEAALAWQHVNGGPGEFALWGHQAELSDDWTAARAWHQLAVRFNPEDGDLWYRLAYAAANLGDPAATAHYEQALAAPRHNLFGPSNILTRLGELSRNAIPSDWPAALAYYDDALRRDAFVDTKDRLQAQLGRAEALDKLGQTVAALDAYRQVAAEWPNHYWANVHSGRLTWYVEKDTAHAVAFLSHAISLRPDDKWAYLFLGGVYVETGQADLGVPLLRRVLEIDPADTTARQQLDQLTGGDGS